MTDPIQQIEERVAQLKFCPDSGLGQDIQNLLKLVQAFKQYVPIRIEDEILMKVFGGK